MTRQPAEAPPISCALSAADLVKRRQWIADLNAKSLIGRRREDLILHLAYRPEARDQVLEMVRNEEDCCGFLTFNVQEDSDTVRLTISAPEAARDAFDALFAPFEGPATPSASSACSCC